MAHVSWIRKTKSFSGCRPLQRTRRARPSNSVKPCGAALCLCCSTGGYTGGATAMSASAQLGPRNALFGTTRSRGAQTFASSFTLPMTCPPSFTWTCSTRTVCCPPVRRRRRTSVCVAYAFIKRAAVDPNAVTRCSVPKPASILARTAMAAVCALRVTPAELRRRAEHRYALERDTKLQSPLNAR